MSRKSCSSKREASQRADSTSASGVALPYFWSRRRSSEPALTPMRIGVPWSFAALAISLTLSSNCLMLPGLTRTAAQPGLDRGEDVLRLEVDVGDDRDLRLAGDRRQRVGVVLRGAGDPDDLAAGGRQFGDLLQRGADVRRTRRGHRLHRHRGVSADRHGPDLDLPALPALGELGRNGRHAERNRSHLLCNPKSWIKVRVPVRAGSRLRDYGTGTGPSTPPPRMHSAGDPHRSVTHPLGRLVAEFGRRWADLRTTAAGRRSASVPGRREQRCGYEMRTGLTTSAISTSSVKQTKIPATT